LVGEWTSPATDGPDVTRVVVGTAVLASPASADPTGSKNSFLINGTCGDRTIQVVVNSANGKGQGAQNNNVNQAELAPLLSALGRRRADIALTRGPAARPRCGRHPMCCTPQ
jgi:hypothetical protein